MSRQELPLSDQRVLERGAMARVLALSSHVARGCVGLAATVPALQWLGHEVWALPTVVLASRPGLGPIDAATSCRRRTSKGCWRRCEADGCWRCSMRSSPGYFPSPPRWPRRRKRLPHEGGQGVALVCVDPILGDARPPVRRAGDRRGYPRSTGAAGRCGHPESVRADMADRHAPRSAMTSCDRPADLGRLTVVVTSAAAHRRRRRDASGACEGSISGVRARTCTPFRTVPATCWPDFPRPPATGVPAKPRSRASLQSLDRVLAASEGQAVLNLAALHREPT